MNTAINVRKIFAGVLAFIVGVGLSACGSADASSHEDDVLERIQKTGEINIGVSGDMPPYQTVDKNGELEGFEISIAESIAKSLNAKVVWHKAPWDSLIAGLEADRYDIVLHNLVVTPEREAKYDHSVTYANDPGVILVADSVPGETIDDIKGKTIATGITSDYATALKDKGINVVDIKTDAAELIKAGRADGFAAAKTVIDNYLATNPPIKLKVLEGKLNDTNSVVFFKKNQPELKKKINAEIERGLKSGDYKQFFEKYAKFDLTPASTSEEQ